MKIIQEPAPGSSHTRFTIEFNEHDRNEYVRRFLEIFNADIDEQEMCARAWEVHCEIRHQHDLYLAVRDNLEPRYRRALHVYAQCDGRLPERQRDHERPDPRVA